MFYFVFIFGILRRFLFKDDKEIIKLKTNLKETFNLSYANLVGQCREGIYYSVKYAIEKTKKRDVLISSYTLYTVVNMIISAGGRPIFMDIQPKSFSNSYSEIKKNLSSETACIIITHLVDINDEVELISELANQNNVFLIEDSAVSFGAVNKRGSLSCTFGDFGVLSFQALKNVQCLNGGAVVSNNKDFHDWLEKRQTKLAYFSSAYLTKRLLFVFLIDFLTKTKVVNFIFFQILKVAHKNNINLLLQFIRADHQPTMFKKIPKHYFMNLTNVQAKFVNFGMENNEKNRLERVEIAKFYEEKLWNVKGITLLPNRYIYNKIHLEFPILCDRRDELFAFLLKENVDVRKFYYRNLSKLDCYLPFQKKCKNADLFEQKILSLPCYPGYSLKSMNKIVTSIKRFYFLKN